MRKVTTKSSTCRISGGQKFYLTVAISSLPNGQATASFRSGAIKGDNDAARRLA
ncbi:hypothetical protein [Tardiphaga sp. 768_D3_N2_1]|uniref:hypothetical protein n=1 Tax=Tardiphaga sp. 768_D3_N2_1 TaxID=3240783 RepID=UPI003F8A959F